MRVDGSSAVLNAISIGAQMGAAIGANAAQTVSSNTSPIAGPQPVIITRPDGVRTDGSGVLMTGNEPPYEPDRWNFGRDHPIQKYNNCYAYAVNDLQHDRSSKPQPGERAGLTQEYFMPGGQMDIQLLQRAIAADGRGGNITFLGNTPQSTLQASEDTYIVALVVDHTDGIQDYHWYRHNADGSWSGKGGDGPATNLDANGALMLDPRTADRNYGTDKRGTLNYTEFVGYYAVRNGAPVGAP